MDYFIILKSWLKYFLKQHGLKKTLKGIFLYHYRILKLLSIDVTKEHIVKVNGCTLALIPNDKGISEELLLFNSHEPLNTEALTKELTEGMTCLDIGGNIGYYATLESRLVGKTGHVIAIEPSPVNLRYLKRNLDSQNMSNYEVHNFACGNENGEIRFSIYKKSNLSRILEDNEKATVDTEIIKIPIKTVDSFLKERSLDKLELLRMDVEGHEQKVLEGAIASIKKFKPIIQVEVHLKLLGNTNTKKFLQDLKNYGYEIKYYTPRELDVPGLGNKKDICKVTIDQLIKKLENGLLPKNFILLLVNQKK